MCSWLNPNRYEPRAALEHEQVHFAIVEGASRDATNEHRDQLVRGRGADREAAIRDLESAMRRLAETVMRRAARIHDAFDAESEKDGVRATAMAWSKRYTSVMGTPGP
jgi:hypothetical protein